MDEKTLLSLVVIVDYLWYEELMDFEDAGKPADHIFRHLKRVGDFIKSQVKN